MTAFVDVPEGWSRRPLIEPQGAVLFREPEPRVFASNLVLTDDPIDGSFRDWQVAADLTLPTMLEDYLLLDLERLPVLGAQGGRRLATYRGPDGVSLTLEQWCGLVEGRGVTLTATMASVRFAEVAPTARAAAASLRLGER